jgi:hypothetical protein
MHHASHFVTNVRMEEEVSDNTIEQLKEYSTSLAFTGRHTTPVLRAIQRVGDSDNVAPATGDLCHGCKTKEWHVSDSPEHDRSPQESYAVLSTTSVANSDKHMLAGAYTPAPTVCHGCSPVCTTASSLASIRDSELPVGLYKNNIKPTPIDRNFFKSMAKTIKANRASIPDPEFVDEHTCMQYTGYYTSNSCGGKTRYVNWIVGEAMRIRIELKFCLIHERMLRLRTIGVFGDESEYVVGSL